jgi:RHS repeat-associated protein
MRTSHTGLSEVVDFARNGYDTDLGTVRMGVRDYDPYLSQFWTPDPLFLEDLNRCQKSPVECGLYSYAGNDPLNYVDPTGMEKDSCKADAKKPPPKKHKPPKKKKPPEPKKPDPDEGIEVYTTFGDHKLQTGDFVSGDVDVIGTFRDFQYDWNNKLAFEHTNIGMNDYDQFRAWYSAVSSTRATGFTNDIRLNNSGVIVTLVAKKVWRMKQIGVTVNGSGGASATGSSDTSTNWSRSVSMESKLAAEANIGIGKIGSEATFTGTRQWGGGSTRGGSGTDGSTGGTAWNSTVWAEETELVIYATADAKDGPKGSTIGYETPVGNFTLFTFYDKATGQSPSQTGRPTESW